MDLFAPEYASRFRCIADKCKNSCCVGWEIGIDEKTRKLYKQLDGRLGEKMAACLSEDQDGAVIRLGCDGRCPFLDSRGLCDIIKEKGEEWLSEICREHPRYYNLLSSRAEWGIGLACEAAATLILECDDIRRTVKGEYPSEAIEDETEAFVLGVREQMLNVIYDSPYSLSERIRAISTFAECADSALCAGELGKIYPTTPLKVDTGVGIPAFSEALGIIGKLDFLDGEFEKQVLKASKSIGTLDIPDKDSEVYITRVMAYILHRYLTVAYEAGEIGSYTRFAIIFALCAYSMAGNGANKEERENIARRLSREIEYNEENRDMLLECTLTEKAFSHSQIISYLE